MVQPTWLVQTLAGLMVTTSIYCVTRLVAARAWSRTLHRDTNLAHTADGVAMAGMLVGSLRTLPTGVWEVIFGGFIVWFAGRGARFVWRPQTAAAGDHLSHYLSHLVMSGAMLFMFADGTPGTSAASGSMAMGGGSSSNLGTVALLFVFALFASAVWHADGMSRYTTARPALVATGVGPGTWSGPSPTASFGAGPDAGDDTLPGDDPAPDTDRSATVDGQSQWLAPRLEMACHVALCITMGYMLILLL